MNHSGTSSKLTHICFYALSVKYEKHLYKIFVLDMSLFNVLQAHFPVSRSPPRSLRI